jgi:hypothetical protein
MAIPNNINGSSDGTACSPRRKVVYVIGSTADISSTELDAIVIYDQGATGNSWGYATANAFSYAYMQAMKTESSKAIPPKAKTQKEESSKEESDFLRKRKAILKRKLETRK